MFRLLVQQGPGGLTAGAIAERVEVPASSLSLHLAHLERAGLPCSWRVRRDDSYAMSIKVVRRLLGFVIDDCCQRHPEIC